DEVRRRDVRQDLGPARQRGRVDGGRELEGAMEALDRLVCARQPQEEQPELNERRRSLARLEARLEAANGFIRVPTVHLEHRHHERESVGGHRRWIVREMSRACFDGALGMRDELACGSWIGLEEPALDEEVELRDG